MFYTDSEIRVYMKSEGGHEDIFVGSGFNLYSSGNLSLCFGRIIMIHRI